MTQTFAANSVVDECASTNDLAKKLGDSGAPNGTWISARRQTAGRGRLGRTWTSEEGNLFLSVVIRGDFGSRRTWLPLVAAVGVARALPASVKIKWPNDLTIKTPDGLRKLGGLLCEAHGSGRDTYFVVGVGVNVVSAPDFVMIPTARLSDLAQDRDLNELRADVLEGVIQATAELAGGGLSSLRAEYDARAAFRAGDEVDWTTGAKEQSGRVLGLGEFGELKVESGGQRLDILADDIRTRLRVY